MTITDPEILKKVAAYKLAVKAAYQETKGKPETRGIIISTCKTCGMRMGQKGGGTLKYVEVKNEKGMTVKVAVHVGCPGRNPNARRQISVP